MNAESRRRTPMLHNNSFHKSSFPSVLAQAHAPARGMPFRCDRHGCPCHHTQLSIAGAAAAAELCGSCGLCVVNGDHSCGCVAAPHISPGGHKFTRRAALLTCGHCFRAARSDTPLHAAFRDPFWASVETHPRAPQQRPTGTAHGGGRIDEVDLHVLIPFDAQREDTGEAGAGALAAAVRLGGNATAETDRDPFLARDMVRPGT